MAYLPLLERLEQLSVLKLSHLYRTIWVNGALEVLPAVRPMRRASNFLKVDIHYCRYLRRDWRHYYISMRPGHDWG